MRDELTEAQKRVLAIMLEFDCLVSISIGAGASILLSLVILVPTKDGEW